MQKNAQATTQLHSSLTLVMIKILQARFQQYVNHELSDVQAGLEKAEEPEIKLSTSAGSLRKQESSRKNICFCFIDYAILLTVWITINWEKFWKRWEYQTTWPASWETYVHVRKQQLKLDMEQD